MKPTLCLSKTDFVKNFGHNFGKHPTSYPCFAKREEISNDFTPISLDIIEVAYLPPDYMFLPALDLIQLGMNLKFTNLDKEY